MASLLTPAPGRVLQFLLFATLCASLSAECSADRHVDDEAVSRVDAPEDAAGSGAKFPLVVVSTLDGLVSGFSPSSGPAPLWVVSPASGKRHAGKDAARQKRPAVSSFQEPGWPELLPAIDGSVYVLADGSPERVDEEQQVVSGDGKRATLVSKVETRVLFVDPASGEVLRHQEVSEENGENSSDNLMPLGDLPEDSQVLVLSYTSHSVQARDMASNNMVSNATLSKVSSVLVDSAACIAPAALLASINSPAQLADAKNPPFTATVSASRQVLALQDTSAAKTVWTAHVGSPIVHAEGLAGVSLQLLPDAPQLPAGTRALTAFQPWAPPDPGGDQSANPAVGSERIPGAELQWSIVALVLVGAVLGAVLVIGLQRYSSKQNGAGLSKSARRRNRRKKEKQDDTAEEEPANRHATSVGETFSKPNRETIENVLPRSSSAGPDPESTHSTEPESGDTVPTTAQQSFRDPITGRLVIGRISITSKVLGYGSHGTLVYEGYMEPEGRRVAVKRLLRQFYDAARKEIRMLIELDEASPWVLRYFAMEEDAEFIYLALELCDGSLADKVTAGLRPAMPKNAHSSPQCRAPPIPLTTRTALSEMMSGLADLHDNGVVHRDFKPQNILMGYPKASEECGRVRIADVGLALKLEGDRSSYTAATGAGAGTVGWRAPEVLSGGRQTKSVDIFSAGCILGYVLTGGQHPFGSQAYERDGNIMSGRCDLAGLQSRGYAEATDLVARMLCREPKLRLTASQATQHPFFWSDAMRLNFLIDVWDRLSETERRNGTDRLDAMPGFAKRYGSWPEAIDMAILKYLYRSYEATISGLIRCIRNKRSHYAEFPRETRSLIGPLPRDSGEDTESHNFGRYFFSRFPSLVIDVLSFASNSSLFLSDPHFARYFGVTAAFQDKYGGPQPSRIMSIRSALREAGSEDYAAPPTVSLSPALSAERGVADPGARRAVVSREQFVSAMSAPRTRSFPAEESLFWDAAEASGILDSTAGFRWRRRLRGMSARAKAEPSGGSGSGSGSVWANGPPGFV